LLPGVVEGFAEDVLSVLGEAALDRDRQIVVGQVGIDANPEACFASRVLIVMGSVLNLKPVHARDTASAQSSIEHG